MSQALSKLWAKGSVVSKLSKRVIVIGLIVSLFLIATAIPVASAKSAQIPSIEFHMERRGVVRFEEFILISPELGMPPGSFYKANVYAFETKEGLVLVDSGAEDLYQSLIEAIEKRFNNKPIIAVLLTHGHADHAGAGSYFLEMGVPVYAPIGDAYLIQTGMNFPGIPSDFTYTGYMPTGYLYGGETVFGLTVIPTPGHSPGSICFIDQRTGALFAGDTTIAYPEDDISLEDMTFEMEYMTLLFTDNYSLQVQLDSLNVLLGLATDGQAETLLPGHNEAYHPSREVQRYIINSIDVVSQVLLTR